MNKELTDVQEDYILNEAKEKYLEKKNAMKHEYFATLYCKSCKLHFNVIKDYGNVITCPYCGDYVEG